MLSARFEPAIPVNQAAEDLLLRPPGRGDRQTKIYCPEIATGIADNQIRVHVINDNPLCKFMIVHV